MEINFKKLSEKYYDEALKATIEFCKIDSVYDESTKTTDAPYGKGVNEALIFVKNFGEKHGFESEIIDNRCAELTYGKGEKLISIFAHADVVPVTGFWTTPAFEPSIRDGKLYGRGTSDDKGPFMSSFFAAKLLIDNGLVDNYRIRFVVGGDEERGSSCLENYFSHKETEIPTYGFTPDSSFPLIYGEKGIAGFKSTFCVDLDNIESIHGGVVSNAVIDECHVVLKNADENFVKYLNEKNIEFSEKNEKEIVFLGKAAHGSVPEEGVNAAIVALRCIGDFYMVEKLKELVSKISSCDGKGFDCFVSSSNLGETTFNIGILDYKNGEICYITNYRHPENITAKECVKKYDENVGTKTELLGDGDYLLFPTDSEIVKRLFEAYQIESGDYETKPQYTGGGTYAKEAKNTVAFGACFPGENTHMHEPDEFMSIENFNRCIAIYAHAIYLLGK